MTIAKCEETFQHPQYHHIAKISKQSSSNSVSDLLKAQQLDTITQAKCRFKKNKLIHDPIFNAKKNGRQNVLVRENTIIFLQMKQHLAEKCSQRTGKILFSTHHGDSIKISKSIFSVRNHYHVSHFVRNIYEKSNQQRHDLSGLQSKVKDAKRSAFRNLAS